MFQFRRPFVVALYDSCMAALSLAVALYLRLGTDTIRDYQDFWPSILLFTVIATTVFAGMGLYRGMWRYASTHDLQQIVKATSLAILLFLPSLFLFNRLEDFPRSVFAIHWLVLIGLLGGGRFFYRYLKDRTQLLNFVKTDLSDHTPILVLLVGVSDTSIHFLRECATGTNCQYRVIGIIDIENQNIGRNIQNISVLGNINDIPKIVKKLTLKGKKPQRIILGMDRVDGKLTQQLLATANDLGLPLAKLPKLTDFKENVGQIEIKPIMVEDLLGRAQNTPKKETRDLLIRDQNILVTGAGGTIGSELVRQIVQHHPAFITLLDHSEFNLYNIDKELRHHFPHLAFRSVLCDIRNDFAMEQVFASQKPNLVFHAAALKHVPLVEENIIEAALTNIIGVKVIADLCQKYHVSKMIFISTDKAVNPSSLMGVTKRIAERYISALSEQAAHPHSTQFATVRFGNVLGSSGSVIPLFQEQLNRGGPLTVTHPDMVRFFMTVPEAVELVLRAATIDTTGQKNGNIFVLDMGNPVRINDLAKQMIQLAGLELNKDIQIIYTGIRPGEKLYEELFYAHECSVNTGFDGIMYAFSQQEDLAGMEKALYDIRSLCQERDEQAVLSYLTALVPQYFKPSLAEDNRIDVRCLALTH